MTSESGTDRDIHQDDVGPNEEARQRWNGSSGEIWVQLAEELDATLAPWVDVLLDAAAIGEGDRVLDVGSGNGATTLAAAARTGPSGLAVGVDLSEPMVARARERGRGTGAPGGGRPEPRFVVGDCQTDDLQVEGTPYDVAISRFGVMFFDSPVTAFANVREASRPDGRLVFLSWAPALDQQWLMVPFSAALEHVPMPEAGGDGPGMFGLSDQEKIFGVLAAAGWVDIQVERCTRPMPLGGTGGPDDAARFLLSTGAGRVLVDGVAPEIEQNVRQAIREALTGYVTPRGVELNGVTWLVTARRPGRRADDR